MALVDLKKAELIALCEENGLDTEGTKAEASATATRGDTRGAEFAGNKN